MYAVEAFYKKQGETPLAAIGRFKRVFPEYAHEKIAYAGRLDPMADGLLLLLVGDACKERDTFQSLEKTYECTCVIGFATDTYDILGMCTKQEAYKAQQLMQTLQPHIDTFPYTFNQHYPPYSSYHVDGKPLWKWARDGELSHIVIPTKEVTLFSFQEIGQKIVTASDLLHDFESRISKVEGDFRQDEIIQEWQNRLLQEDQGYIQFSFSASVSSGFYIRSLVHTLFPLPATTISITRTRVGEWTINKEGDVDS